ncbi:unnamed protein product [Prorocentrum cordatum]|uniref:Uncharacterized protein n=1 Tax=Prorocentrum cordatum TaxID=2364126 RepID=A0ABN9UZX0_9DINO|nr:unnamed protein product [Polarella glacialis]
MAAIMQQLAVLCKRQRASSIPPLRFEPVNASSGLGFELKAMENLKHGVTIESLHRKSVEFWMERFAGSPIRRASYLVPLGAAWQAFNKTWGISASVYLDVATLEMYKTLYIPTFCRKYEIKGVPAFRYLRSGGAAGVYGDANWVAHFVSKDGKTASVGVAQEHWDKLVTQLAEDLDLLRSTGSVGYSMLVSVFEDVQPDPDAQNPLGKRAWQAFNFETQDLEVVLFGGIVDYLQTAEIARLEGRVVGTDIGSELVESPGVYACRLLLFISTHMLAPCKWPKSDSKPKSCVKDWTEAFHGIFKSEETSAGSTFLPQICERFDGGPADLKRIAAGLIMHVDEKLDNDRPCVNGFRAPEHCIDKWTYKGEEYTQCARTQFEYSEVLAPWCSWEHELPENSGWDGPWSYCTRCFGRCDETADVEAVVHPCQCGEHLCQTGRTCSRDPRPDVGLVCEDLDGRTLARKFCESGRLGDGTPESPGSAHEAKGILGSVQELCESGHDLDAELLPGTPVGGKVFLLKAQGSLDHGLVFKEITPSEKNDWEKNFASMPPTRASYLVPMLTTFEAYGMLWGVEPNSFLDNPPPGDNYHIKGFTNFAWTNDWPSGLSISVEHWEKLTIRLSQDMESLKDAKSSMYEMGVTVFDEPLYDTKNSRGKHVWRAHGWDDNKNVGVLLGGVTDYLDKGSHDGADSEGSSDSVYACRLFLFVTTQALTPCRWSRSVANPQEEQCVRDFTPVFEAILGRGEVPPATDQHALSEICRLVDQEEGSLLRFEAELLSYVVGKLDGDMPCENGVRLPEHCVQSTKYAGQSYAGCVADVSLFDDVRAPWCAWEAELDPNPEWDGPWSYCVVCPQSTPAPPDLPPTDEKSTPAPPDRTFIPPTSYVLLAPVRHACSGHAVADAVADDTTTETLKQLHELCRASGGELSASGLPSGRGGGRVFLLKAQGPLKIDLVFRSLAASEQAYARGQREAPVEHSLLVPLLSVYDSRVPGDEVWAVMPSTRISVGSEGMEMKSYDIVGLPNDPRNAGWLEDHPASSGGFAGVGISQEHWAKLIIRLVEDLRTLKEHHAIDYALEITTFRRSPEEDARVKNSRGKHVLRAYDPRTKGLIGVLPGGVVDYLKDARLERDVGVSDSMYACEFLLTTATQVLRPCKWPIVADTPPEEDCVTDFYPALQQMLPGDEDTLPSEDDPSLISRFCTAIEDSTQSLFACAGSLLEFVDGELNGDKPCIGAHEGHPGFRAPEHCAAEFTYDGGEFRGCVAEAIQELPSGTQKQQVPGTHQPLQGAGGRIRAPWCSWTDALHGGTDWDGPWSFCTRLMVASCYRRMGASAMALKLYEEIHRAHPNDIECVRYLITICKEMNQKYDHYAAHLRKLERAQEQGVGGGAAGQGLEEEDGDLTQGAPGRQPVGSLGGGFEEDFDGGPDLAPRTVELYQADEAQLSSKAAPKRRLAAAARPVADDDGDGWGDGDLDDILPP